MIWPEIGAAMPSRLRPPPPTPAADTMLCACVSAIRASVAAVRAAIRSCSGRSEEHTSELQSLMRISYAVFCLKKTTITTSMHRQIHITNQTTKVYMSHYKRQLLITHTHSQNYK